MSRIANPLLRAAENVDLGLAQMPLLGAANLWIEDSLDGVSIRLTQSVVQQALAKTAAGQLEVVVFDDALSGLAAPFSSLNSGGEKILHVLHDEQDFKTTLRQLRDHVQAVKNVMRGETANLVEFRREIDYPVEGYKLVVVSTDLSFLDDASQTQLGILLRAGPVAGVSFLIHSMTLDVNPYVLAMCDQVAVKQGILVRDGQSIRGWLPSTPTELIATSQQVTRTLAGSAMAPIALSEVQDLYDPWRHTSENGVTFAIGKYGREAVEVTLGDELNQRHNLLITGAVGQGKSNLLSVIIHSLCQRYAPRELELYLLDFKEGVTLQPFFDERSGQYLPHARVLGLDADREFGHSVLLRLHAIYRDRMKLFKAAGVQNIRQYRQLRSETEMPRILVVIDEFQMMFADRDRVSDEIADLLVRGVRLFRACGIHVILASQTIGGNMSLMGAAGEGLFAQVPVRVALKNSLVESRATLGDRNDAAVHLRAREAIVNEDYGDFSANKKTTIAFADEKLLAPLRACWWHDSKESTAPPYVFFGERRRSITTDVARLRELRGGPLTLLLGSRIEVDAHPLEVPFGRDVGRNVAVIGSGDAVPVVEHLALSLAFQAPRTRFVVIDFLDGHPAWETSRDIFLGLMGGIGAQVDLIGKKEMAVFLTDLAMSLADRDEETELVIVGLGLDRCRTISLEFQEIIKTGPSTGVHVIGWWLKYDSFREQVGYGGESFFDIRIALKLDSQSAKQLMNDPLLEWRATENRALVWDATEMPAPLRVIPYTVLDDEILGD